MKKITNKAVKKSWLFIQRYSTINELSLRGGIGRHAWLRIMCDKHVGSSPTEGNLSWIEIGILTTLGSLNLNTKQKVSF